MLESVLTSSASTVVVNKLTNPNIDNLFCISVKAKSQSIQSSLFAYDKNQAAFALFRLSVAAMTSIPWQEVYIQSGVTTPKRTSTAAKFSGGRRSTVSWDPTITAVDWTDEMLAMSPVDHTGRPSYLL
ncbi:hypothetical protein BD560DRAFT_438318 [Blakeslea trispora]|nr:hypothetical protein BD560DRAFT_438318 [Blakeslea trispora]